MDVISIPVNLDRNATIDESLQLLQAQNMGGFLDYSGRRPQLFFMRHILEASDRLETRLSDIWGEIVMPITGDEAQRYGLDLFTPLNTEAAFMAYFNGPQMRGVDYMVLEQPGDVFYSPGVPMAQIVSRHESQGGALRTSGGYQCNGTPRHYFPDPLVNVGQFCPQSPECSRSDGTTPVVEVRP